jgi:hypothetical protein
MYLEGIAAFRAAIATHRFAVISLLGSHHIRQDTLLHQAVAHNHSYVLLTRAGGAPTWIYPPDYRRAGLPGLLRARSR